jgi:hypothetical protein
MPNAPSQFVEACGSILVAHARPQQLQMGPGEGILSLDPFLLRTKLLRALSAQGRFMTAELGC